MKSQKSWNWTCQIPYGDKSKEMQKNLRQQNYIGLWTQLYAVSTRNLTVLWHCASIIRILIVVET